MGIHVFTGPTAVDEAVREILPSSTIHPPAQHGDFFRSGIRSGDIAVLVDGLYHGSPPIRHKEIVDAIARGVVVVGAASMGALRAAELHQVGMIGVGKIFGMYRDGEIEADDEVAVLHTEGPDWTVLSEALVNMRHTLHLAQAAGDLSPQEHEQLLRTAQRLHYTRRSWRSVAAACAPDPVLLEAAQRAAGFAARSRLECNLKRQDALEALHHAASLASAKSRRPTEVHWADGWRTAYLAKWRHEFTGSRAQGRFVSLAAQFDHTRLFGTDQPERWRRYVLAAVADSPHDLPLTQLEDLALAAAAERGINADDEHVQGAFKKWLTRREQEFLDLREQLLTALTRSSRLTPDLTDKRVVHTLLPQQDRTRELIAESLQINDRVAETSFSKHTDHLKRTVLHRHLALIWNLPVSCPPRELDAAAQDRGFRSADEATEALRPFFLMDYNRRQRNGA